MTTERDMRQEWETPDDFFKVLDQEFSFHLDAAATFENRKCSRYLSPADNALSPDTRWIYSKKHHIWLNPGFANIYPWMEKAYSESQSHRSAVVVVMALISPSTKWWREWATRAAEIRLLGGKRVQFKAPPGIKQSCNSRENCLVIFRHDAARLPAHIWTWDWTK